MEEHALRALLSSLSYQEKVGQLVQVSAEFFGATGEVTGPMSDQAMDLTELYQVGSVLGTHTREQVERIQRDYLAHCRHGIPLLFMADVIHGYQTIYPIPLALAGSFDEGFIEAVARHCALEASQAGIQVTFAPMADLVRDARWGRVLESNGEDPRLNATLSAAYVRGYQGEHPAAANQIATCTKHFIGYGAAEAGRDYQLAELSDWRLAEDYLPAFQAAIAAGSPMVMTGFHSLQGIPMTANQRQIKTVLRQQLNFEGVVISDWAAVHELLNHGVAPDKAQAATMAFEAGVEIDMMSDVYLHHLDVEESQLDEAVWRVLQLKNQLGLFEQPLKLATNDVSVATKRQHARLAAERSAVLLKNNGALPLNTQDKVAVIGPKATSQDVLGAWSWIGKQEEAIDLASGMLALNPHVKIAGQADEQLATPEELQKMLRLAATADKVIIAVGESSAEAGEAASKADLRLSKAQRDFIHAVSRINPHIILVVHAGRPLVLTELEPAVEAIVYAWFLGSESGHALANLLYGQANFSAKLAMSLPRSVGQLPMSYQQTSTGRPMRDWNRDQKYVSRYLDEANTPLYSFGHGLSYSHFDLQLEHVTIEAHRVLLNCLVHNTSAVEGTTIVQLYTRPAVSTVTLPEQRLSAWQVVHLAPNEQMQLTFELTEDKLAYAQPNLSRCAPAGTYNYGLGLSSQNVTITGHFEWRGEAI